MLHGLFVETEVGGTEGHILLDGRREYLVIGVLEDHPDHLSHFADVCPCYRLPMHQDLAGCRFHDPVEVLEKGALSGAIGSDNGNTGISWSDKIDAVQAGDTARVDIREISGLDQVH